MSTPEQVITLGVVDAEELAELLEFVADLMKADDGRFAGALYRWNGGAGAHYPLTELIGDLERFSGRLLERPAVAE